MAASAQSTKNIAALRSYRMSVRWRAQSCGICNFLFFFDGMQTLMHFIKATLRNQSASWPQVADQHFGFRQVLQKHAGPLVQATVGRGGMSWRE